MSKTSRRSRPPLIRPRRIGAAISIVAFLVLALIPRPALAISVTTQFEGLANADNLALTRTLVAPPDNGLAVGPSHVFEMVNNLGRISDRRGNRLATLTLQSFFQVDSGFSFSDPRVIYDALADRWYATFVQFSMTRGSSSIILAVSATGDPTGAFCRFRLGNPTAETFLHDQPQVGYSTDKVVVAYSAFDLAADTFIGGGYYVLNKSQLTVCAAPSSTRVPPSPQIAPKPAQTLGAITTLYMAAHSNTSATILAIEGVPGATAVTSTPTTISINSWRAPPQALQRGASVVLDTGDARTQSIVWQNGSLWFAGNGACVPPGDTVARSCVRVVEVRTDTMTVRQDITFGAAGQYDLDPGMSLDGSGNLYIVYMQVSSSSFLSVRATGRLATDALNTLQPSILIRAGEGAQTSVDPDISAGRTGDYSGAAADPVDPSKVWVSSEYIGSTGDWGTYVAALTFSNGLLPTFVAALYQDALGRTGSDAEIAAWVDYLLATRAVAGVSTVVHTFFDGPEFRNRSVTPWQYVTFLYETILGRDPSPAEQAAQVIGLLIRFNTLLTVFVGSPEFQAMLGRIDATTFVTRLYQEMLGRTPSATDLAPFTSFLAATGDYATVVTVFADSTEYLSVPRTLDQHVTVLYRALLGRNPGPGETAPAVGYLAAQLAGIEDAFLASPEFQSRFPALFP